MSESSPTTQKNSSITRTSGGRRTLLLTLPYVAVVVLLWVVNLVLPLLDPSLASPFTRDIEADGIACREINRGYLTPYFPASSPLVPEFKPTVFRRVKTADTFRVLCIGESSMYGVPFGMAATIPALVRKQLRHLWPQRDIEVINLGASAINSNAMRDMVPQFLSLQPDLVLVYSGHNEFYGPDGVGISWIERRFPGLTEWKYRLRRLPIVAGLQRLIAKLGGAQSEEDKNLMRQVSEGVEVPLEGPDAERIFRQFEENLRDIVHRLRADGVPVILGDISSNLMFPPFAPRPADQADALPGALGSGRFALADSLIARGLASDSTNAFFLYWKGRLALAEGDSISALALLEWARDNDLLKFRAPGRINGIIHRIGAEESVPVLPIDSVLRSRSPHGITDTTFFCEHLHPTFSGYDLISRQYIQAIIERHLLPGEPAASLLPFDADSLSVPWVDLGYGALSLRTLTSRWPFNAMARRHDVLEHCEGWKLRIVEDIAAHRIGWTEACLDFAKQARDHHVAGATVTSLAAVVEEYPHAFLFRYGLAAALESAGRRAEAMNQYRSALALKPDFPPAMVDYASLLIEEGELDAAQSQLQSMFTGPAGAGASNELRARALYGLAVIATKKDSVSSSLDLLNESLRLAPEFQPALALKSQIARRSLIR